MTDWSAYAERCLKAPNPDETDGDELRLLCSAICKELMLRDDYPSIACRVNNAIVIGRLNSAIDLVEHLFPGWGYQVGRPLTVREPCGCYASIFRERRNGEPFHPHPGSYNQDGGVNTPWRYANSPALAIMAALCRTLAIESPGASALGSS